MKAAIEYLRNGARWGVKSELRDDCQAAIRILEAARKIKEGQKWALDEFDNLVRSAHSGFLPGEKEFHCMPHCRSLIKRFRALLEALPEKEEAR